MSLRAFEACHTIPTTAGKDLELKTKGTTVGNQGLVHQEKKDKEEKDKEKDKDKDKDKDKEKKDKKDPLCVRFRGPSFWVPA